MNDIPLFSRQAAVHSDGRPTADLVEIIQRLQRRIDAIDGTASANKAQSAVWYDFNTSPSVPAGVWTTLDWTTPTVQQDDLASDMTGFVQSGRVLANDGDWFQMRVDIKFSPDDATASFLRFGLDAGSGVFMQPLHPVLLGSGVEDEATFDFITFSSSAFNPAGYLPRVLTDGPISITQTQAFFARLA